MSNITNIQALFGQMWKDYVQTNPDAQKIHDLFVKRGDNVLNDHIALRTFNLPEVGIDVCAKAFLESGYVEKGDYHFEEKKLYAKHYEHPNKEMPKIFISELLVEKFDSEVQGIIEELVSQVTSDMAERFDFVVMGRPWKCSVETYNKLKEKSEYASWLAAFGYRPNHFTVFINALESFKGITELNDFVKSCGFKLNDAGGEIKGSREVYLEQSSTLASTVDWKFDDGELRIPACYYEFAKRYPLESGELYQGFVAKSADKIFESTSRGQ